MTNRRIHMRRSARSYIKALSIRIAVTSASLFGAWSIYYWTEHLLQQPLLSSVAPLFAFVVIVSFRPARAMHDQMGRENSRPLL